MLVDFKQKSQITIPKAIVKKLNLKIGDKLQIDLDDMQIKIIPVAIVPKDQMWFYSERWQKGEREADEDIKHGRVYCAENADEMFKMLDI